LELFDLKNLRTATLFISQYNDNPRANYFKEIYTKDNSDEVVVLLKEFTGSDAQINVLELNSALVEGMRYLGLGLALTE
jgi:hypothetical protein